MRRSRLFLALLLVLMGASAMPANAGPSADALTRRIEAIASGDLGYSVTVRRIDPNAADQYYIDQFRRATGRDLIGYAIFRSDVTGGQQPVERYAFAIPSPAGIVVALQQDAADLSGAWMTWYLAPTTLTVVDTRLLPKSEVIRVVPDLAADASAAAGPRRASPVCTQTFQIGGAIGALVVTFLCGTGVGCLVVGGGLGIASLYGAYECNKVADPSNYGVIENYAEHGFCMHSGCVLDFYSTNPSRVVYVGGYLVFRFHDPTTGKYYGKRYDQPLVEPVGVQPTGGIWHVDDDFSSDTFYGNCGSDAIVMAYSMQFANFTAGYIGPAVYPMQPETGC